MKKSATQTPSTFGSLLKAAAGKLERRKIIDSSKVPAGKGFLLVPRRVVVVFCPSFRSNLDFFVYHVVFPRNFQWHDMASKMSHTKTNPKPQTTYQTSSWTFWVTGLCTGIRLCWRNSSAVGGLSERMGPQFPWLGGEGCCVDGGFTAIFSTLFMEMTQLEKYTSI